MLVLHLKTQRGQPYGSERRCCEQCGAMIWGRSIELCLGGIYVLPAREGRAYWTDDERRYATGGAFRACLEEPGPNVLGAGRSGTQAVSKRSQWRLITRTYGHEEVAPVLHPSKVMDSQAKLLKVTSDAKRILREAFFPKSRSEERLGVDLDVAAMRIMLSGASPEVKEAALKLALRAGAAALRGRS